MIAARAFRVLPSRLDGPACGNDATSRAAGPRRKTSSVTTRTREGRRREAVSKEWERHKDVERQQESEQGGVGPGFAKPQAFVPR